MSVYVYVPQAGVIFHFDRYEACPVTFILLFIDLKHTTNGYGEKIATTKSFFLIILFFN